MAKFYHLGTCSTCRRVLAELGEQPDLELIDIKERPLTGTDVDRMAELAGGYKALFSRRARKYRSEGLADRNLTEGDYRDLILREYTFLKRPVLLTEGEVYVGSAKQTVSAAKTAIQD